MKILRRLFGGDVPGVEDLMRHANEAYRSGRFEEAMTLYSDVIAIDPHYAATYYQRGMAYARSGDHERAGDDFKQVLELTSEPLPRRDSSYNLGLATERSGDDEGAVEWYRKALEIDPDFYRALCNMGGALVRLASKELKTEAAEAKFTQALECLNKALELEPSDAISLLNRATVHSQLGNERSSHEDLSAFMRLTPPDDPLHRLAESVVSGREDYSALLDTERRREYARLIERLRDANSRDAFEEALRLCDVAMNIDLLGADQIRNEVVWDEKAYSLLGLGRVEEAFKCCEQGIRADPGSARLHHSKAGILDHWGRRREALSTYRKYVELAPPEYAAVVEKVKERMEQLTQELGDI